MQTTDAYKKIVDLIIMLEDEESKYKNSFEDISTKIMLKNILHKLHEIRYLVKQHKSI